MNPSPVCRNVHLTSGLEELENRKKLVLRHLGTCPASHVSTDVLLIKPRVQDPDAWTSQGKFARRHGRSTVGLRFR